ncbi:MAG: YihY/virulence factor BrkB family protein [Candidatus Adiutrix sp.]|jgi:membrane protein|nr:YihY/virulence factor BrkB family protein [Candidatus Adiutrix sp.]
MILGGAWRTWKKIGLKDWLTDIYERLEQAGIIGWPVQATALSYYCILGLVPFLALCFAIARNFGLEAALAEAIDHWFSSSFSSFEGQQEVIAKLKSFSDNLINNYSGSVMAFVALGVIFWSGYRILTLLEAVFGDIFGYHPPRLILHRVLDYSTVMIIMPLVLMASLTVNIYLTGLANASWDVPLGINPSQFISIFIIISPYIILWLVFSWAYAYFSRGLMGWRERLLGGFATAMLFQTSLTVYVKIMFALTSYNAIYSSFAAIPLFMIWLYIGWVIVLGGGELTRRFSDLFVIGGGFSNFGRLTTPATWRATLELSSQALAVIINNYQSEPTGGPTCFRQISRATRAPLPALGVVINRLLDVRLIVLISSPAADGPAFLPARSPDQLTPASVQAALETGHLKIYN